MMGAGVALALTPQPELWTRVSEIIDHTSSVDALRHHGVHLIAAAQRRARNISVAPELLEDQRRASLLRLAAPALLHRVRCAYDGRLVLIKGPEVAAGYPAPELRPFCDLDLLADDPAEARGALLAAGFVEVGDPERYRGLHHLRPLAWPNLPLSIELHHTLKYPQWVSPPPTVELLELTRPSATGVDGLLGLLPAVHAVALALHSWAHQPLRRLLDLIDVMIVMDTSERDEADRLARRWGLYRIWNTTISAAEALLGDRPSGVALATWARHLAAVRERTVLETHLTRWAGPRHGLPGGPGRSLGEATLIFANAARPRSGESWADAIGRTRLAVTNAFRPQSEHDAIRLTSES